ncbi:uncharacterized protein I206_105891 [Kwoniella pini CBS 10737]|uniref:Rieske domain-containing protein n=1 Tax=Kwoniella pini CBS 10737 TaxID=1296096 RepID=A0AAJ8MSN0_9TREE
MNTIRPFIRICPLQATYSHTRFHLSLRTIDPPIIYHRLLLFRITKPEESISSETIGPSWKAPELYCMEETCPHLGAPLSHAEIEDIEDTKAIVCPWHQYDFDLNDGSSSTGLQACTYEVQVKGIEGNAEVWVEAPHPSPNAPQRQWELVEMRGVSEEFLDPPIPSLSRLSLSQDVEHTSRSSFSTSNATLPEELPNSLLGFAHLILRTSNPELKCLLTREAVTRLRAGKLKSIRPSVGEIKRERDKEGGLLDEPPREVEMIAPGKAPRRGKGGSEKSRIMMLHALANIEQYAIDLAWDIIARFADCTVNGERLPVEFFLDWAKVAEDEAKHYTLLARRLVELGSYFGAHTAIIHLVAEARGIDMNPLTLAKLQAAGDKESSRVLEIIHSDEITHVTTGHRWFTWLGKIKGPFNSADRLKAGLTPDFYEDLHGGLGSNLNKTEDGINQKEPEGDEHIHPRLA